jgi:AcrR family transcriptional regulator
MNDAALPRGRPRSEAARQAVLDAALRLCARDGYAQLTMKGIADEAGVGRQTVYRWWPTKADVLLEALADIAERELPRFHRTGDALRDVHSALRLVFSLLPVTGKPLSGLMADAQHDPELSARLQERLLGPRRELVEKILEDGIAAGQLRRNVEPKLVSDLLFGTMWYRLLGGHAPVDDRLADDLREVARRLLT